MALGRAHISTTAKQYPSYYYTDAGKTHPVLPGMTQPSPNRKCDTVLPGVTWNINRKTLTHSLANKTVVKRPPKSTTGSSFFTGVYPVLL